MIDYEQIDDQYILIDQHQRVNIYKFASELKERAYKQGWIISSRKNQTNRGKWVAEIIGGEWFYGDTEPTAIIAAYNKLQEMR